MAGTSIARPLKHRNGRPVVVPTGILFVLQGKLFAVDQIIDRTVKIIGHVVQKRKGGLALARLVIGQRFPRDMQVHRHLLLAQTALFSYLPQAFHIDKIVTFCYIEFVTICYIYIEALNE